MKSVSVTSKGGDSNRRFWAEEQQPMFCLSHHMLANTTLMQDLLDDLMTGNDPVHLS